MGNSFCLDGNIRLSVNHQPIYDSMIDLVVSNGESGGGRETTHVMGNVKSHKLHQHHKLKTYDNLRLKLDFINPILDDIIAIDCLHGSVQVILTNPKTQQCVNLILVVDSSKFNPITKQTTIRFKGKMSHQIHLYGTYLQFVINSQYLSLLPPI